MSHKNERDINIDDWIEEINQLVKKGELLQALKKAETYIGKSQRSLELLKKYAYLQELAGNIEIAELLYISLIHYFPNQFDAKIALLNFCFRNGKLKNIANKLKKWKEKYGKNRRYLESQVKLLKSLSAYDEAKIITKKYIRKFPGEAFGYVNLINVIANIRPANYRSAIDEVAEQNGAKKFAFRIHRTLNHFKGNHINTFQPGTKFKFTHSENSRQLLKSFFIHNAVENDVQLDYIFDKPLNIKAIRTLSFTMVFSQHTHHKFLAYLDENPKWKDYQIVKDYLLTTTQNIGITAQPKSYKPLPKKKVDIVYTWCDNNDEQFRAKLNQLLETTVKTKSSSNNEFRYQQMGEIKLSLLSVQKYFSRVNRIYIVTNQQQFDIGFLQTSFQNKIQFVDHTEIMPENLTDRGVFNSNLIETFVWKIKDLSECFLYINDDVILGDYIKEEYLFNEEQVPYTTLIPHHFEKYKITKDLLALSPETSFYESCLYNAHQQFVNHFKIEPRLGSLHQFMIMTKTSCKEFFNIMLPAWKETFFKDFIRGNNSVYTLMMYNWYALLKGHQVLGPYHLYRRRSIYFSNEIYAENVETLRRVKPLFYCLNYISDATSKKLLDSLIKELT